MILTRRTALLASLGLAAACRSRESPQERAPIPASSAAGLLVLSIHDGWGKATVDGVELVLMSAAATLLEHAPGRILHAVSVRPCAEAKRCAEAPFSDREGTHFVVVLQSTDLNWNTYVFEFAHELCHVLAKSAALASWIDPEATWREHVERPNRWFEEAICETASLFTLRRMADTWRTQPPVPHWSDYAHALQETADAKTRDPARSLPSGVTLPDWYRASAAALRDVRFDRAREAIVAGILLPMFEREPSGWDAVSYLDHGSPRAWTELEHVLANWHANVPAGHRAFVAAIADRFGFSLR